MGLIVGDCMDSATCSAFTLSCDKFKELYHSLNMNTRSTNSNGTNECTRPRVPCSDLIWNGINQSTHSIVWGMDVHGINLSEYTNNQLQWVGCIERLGCEFYCNDVSPTMIEFGSDGANPPRALLGPGRFHHNLWVQDVRREIHHEIL